MIAPDLVVAIDGYRLVAAMHDAAVRELVAQCGEDDAQQASDLQTALRLIGDVHQAIDRAIALFDEAASGV